MAEYQIEVLAGEDFDIVFTETGNLVEIIIPTVGGGGGSSLQFTYNQLAPAATWTIVHNTNSYPGCRLFVDSDPGELVYTDVSYPDSNTVVVEWPSPESGRAEFN